MSSFYEEFERDKAEVLASIRQEVGWSGDPEELDGEKMWEYIELLEAALTAERRVRRMVGPGSDFLLRDEKRALEVSTGRVDLPDPNHRGGS